MHYLRDTTDLYCKRLKAMKDKLKNTSKNLKKKAKEIYIL